MHSLGHIIYTTILKQLLQQSGYIYLYNRLKHNVIMSTFVFLIIRYKLVKNVFHQFHRCFMTNWIQQNQTRRWNITCFPNISFGNGLDHSWWRHRRIWTIFVSINLGDWSYMRTLWYNLFIIKTKQTLVECVSKYKRMMSI